MSIHSHLQYDQSTSHARVPAGGINLIASIDSVSDAQVMASFFGSTKALNGENAIPSAETSTHNHSNQQYSITAITTSAGAIAERYAYSAYGEPTICDSSGSPLATQASSLGNRYSYTGREWDATVGLHHFRARRMSPKTGRFLGRDPIGFEGSEWNIYEYVSARALVGRDPSGTSIVTSIPCPPAVYSKCMTYCSPRGAGTPVCSRYCVGPISFSAYVCKCDPCPACPAPPSPIFDTTHDHGGCLKRTGNMAHWHYFTYNQNPKTCFCRLSRHFGGCGAPPSTAPTSPPSFLPSPPTLPPTNPGGPVIIPGGPVVGGDPGLA